MSKLINPLSFIQRSADRFDRFYIHCLSTQKTLDEKNYTSVDEIKRDVFALFDQGDFNDFNAILTYRNEQNEEILMTNVPPVLPRGQYRDLFLRLIHSSCAMCESSFGILDDQLLFECPTNKCGEQYCKKCVTIIRGATDQHPFMCILCRKDVQPKHNVLVEKYLIWPRIGQLYGAENLFEFERKSSPLSTQLIKNDIQCRSVHLRSRLDAYRRKLERFSNLNETNEKLVDDVEEMCRQCEIILKRIDDIDETMRTRYIDLEQIAMQHKEMSRSFDELIDDSSNFNSNELYQSFLSNKLTTLSTDRTVESVDESLRDINSRKQFLDHLIYHFRSSTVENNRIERLTELSKKLDEFFDELTYLRGNLRAVERYLHEYFHVLSDYRQPEIRAARFIYLLELLKKQTEKLELEENLPLSVHLINAWRKEFDGQEENFQPKVLDLCKTIEEDLKNVLKERKSISSISYRIGVIGQTNVGKSALISRLGNFDQYVSMINLSRSSFGFLQFDTENPKISFIDIAGATDEINAKTVGTYLELITNADCDLYLLLFDRSFNIQNEIWREYIEKTLNKKCFLIRSKADLIFHNFYTKLTAKTFRRDFHDLYGVRHALIETRKYAKTTFDEKQLENDVFLIATGNDDELNDVEFGRFDFIRLTKRIEKLALNDLRVTRLAHFAVLVAKKAINTCFRRGYTVLKTKYRWLAAGVSLIPFLDEVPIFFGREEIRQAFGIHDRSSIANRFRRSKNSLEEFFIRHDFKVPKDSIKSGYFQYLISDELPVVDTDKFQMLERIRLCQRIEPSSNNVSSTGVVEHIFQNVRRVASIAGIIVGAVLTPVTAAWSFYSSGKRMNQHLHLLCDDLQIVLTFFIMKICDEFVSQSILFSSSSSSSDDETFE